MIKYKYFNTIFQIGTTNFQSIKKMSEGKMIIIFFNYILIYKFEKHLITQQMKQQMGISEDLMETKDISMPQRQMDEKKLNEFINIEPVKEKNNNNSENNVIVVSFIKINKESLKINILIDSNEKVSSLIGKYRNKSCDFEKDVKFIYSDKNLESSSLNCSDFGLVNNSIIYFVEN